MAEYDKDTLTAPVYRYYTVDLLTNKVLAEIPFGGVSYERALKSAGGFSGKIPVLTTPSSRSWDLYKSTLPGKTGLYVMRDDECVWGGIIWSRTYDLIERTLNIDASEFPSYLHHRLIWKSWSHIYGATVVSSNGTATVQFDAGSSIDLLGGSSVKFDFFSESGNEAWLRYNGYYTIADTPKPTQTSFTVAGSVSTANILAVERNGGIATVYTKGAHGFQTGNIISVNVIVGTKVLNGRYSIVASSGASSSFFTFNTGGADLTYRTVDGVATRPLPDGTYTAVSVSVRTDTYAYVRALVQSVFNDFTGIDFADAFLTPGQQYKLDVKSSRATAGYATITTKTDHNLIPGQAVNIKNVGKAFDGIQVVIDTPHTDSFRFKTGGEVGLATTNANSVKVIGRAANNGVATVYTDTAHGFKIGNTVTVYPGADLDSNAGMFAGDWVITQVPNSTSFQYDILSPDINIDRVDLTQPTAKVGSNTKAILQRGITSNTAYIVTDGPHGFSVGNSVTVNGIDVVYKITDKNWDHVTKVATIGTDGVHNLSAGDVVNVTGISDTSAIAKKTYQGSTMTLTTKKPHNFKKGDRISVVNVRDGYTAQTRTISSNNVTLTFSHPTNVAVGDIVKVSNIYEQDTVTKGSIANNIGKLTLSSDNLVAVNDRITVTGVEETAKITSKYLHKNVVTLEVSKPHNFKVGQKLDIDGCGKPFDGSYKLTDVTSTKLKYKVKSDASIKETSVKNGTASGGSNDLNGTHTVSTVSGNTIQFPVDGNNVNSISKSGTIRYLSPINGDSFTVTAASGSSVTYASGKTIPNRSSYTIVPSDKKDDPKPALSESSVANVDQVKITAVTRDTFSYSVAGSPSRYNYTNLTTSGSVVAKSMFNGQWTVTAVDNTSFSFTLNSSNDTNVKELPVTTPSYVKASGIFNGTYTITGIDAARNMFWFNKPHADISLDITSAYGLATVGPWVISGTYGPYPGNSDLNILFSTQDYSGDNVEPTDFRGGELTNVGEALDTYSDSINGFEYRIDCAYDADRDAFTRTFVLLPIQYPDPPAKGQVSPPSRFNADRIVFEYPGSITALTIAESAENSSTRFFATGDADTGDSANAGIVGVAAADDLLNAPEGERWPLLDDTEKIDKVTDKDVLYTYADRYLTEGHPPMVSLTVSVNGSLQPTVGNYAPGDWCSLIVNDEFMLQRLRSDLEPRDDIIVRKIQGFKVTVPDGSTVPEKVELTLVQETGVDNVGK